MTEQRSNPRELDLEQLTRGRGQEGQGSRDPFADLADLVSDLSEEIAQSPRRFREDPVPGLDEFGSDMEQELVSSLSDDLAPQAREIPVPQPVAAAQVEVEAARASVDQGNIAPNEEDVGAALLAAMDAEFEAVDETAADEDFSAESETFEAEPVEVEVEAEPLYSASALRPGAESAFARRDDDFESELLSSLLGQSPTEPEQATAAEDVDFEAEFETAFFDDGDAAEIAPAKETVDQVDDLNLDIAAALEDEFADLGDSLTLDELGLDDPEPEQAAYEPVNEEVSADQFQVREPVREQAIAAPVAAAASAALMAGSRAATAESAPELADVVDPYADDISATGDLGVPDFAYVEDVPQSAAGMTDLDIDLDDAFEDLQPQREQGRAVASQAVARMDMEAPQAEAPTAFESEFEALFEDNFKQDFNTNGYDYAEAAQTEEDLRNDPRYVDQIETGIDEALGAEIMREMALDDDAAVAPVMVAPDRRKRGLVVAGAVIAVAVVGVGLLVGSSLFSGDDGAGNSDEPAIVRADNEPIKVVPEDPGGEEVPNQDRAVFDAVSGKELDAPKQEVLVDARETPNIPAPKDEDRIVSGGDSSAAPSDDVLVMAPRRVQTVTVRPDGTLVENAAPSVIEPDNGAMAVPEPRPEPQANVATETAEPVVEAVSDAPVAAPEPATIAAQVPARTVEAQRITQRQNNVPAEAIAVPSRPADQPVNIVNGAQVATAQPVANDAFDTSPAAAQVAAAPGSYVVQIASQPSEAAAQSSYANLSGRFSSIIGGQSYQIRAADIPGKGTFYRVQINAGSRDQANALCSRYKAAGGSCFVTR